METGKKMCILKRVPTTTTVGELKKLFEKEYPSFYPERQAFFLDKTKPGLLFDQKSLQLAGKKGQLKFFYALSNCDCLATHGLTN